MSQHPPAGDEQLGELRADPTLCALAELDSLAPSRALDRAVLRRARAAASAGAHCAGAHARLPLRAGPAFRWGFPAAIAAAAVCAIVVQRTALRPAAPRASDQRVVERMQAQLRNELEMVRVSAQYRGAAPRVGATAAPAYLAASSSGQSHRGLIPSFIETSAIALSTSFAPPRLAPLRKRGSEEWTSRAVATRSSERASRRERESTARRRIRPPELIDSVDLLEVRPSPPPPDALQSAVGSSGHSAQVRDARAQAGPAGPR